jgi:hypothetical protein
MVITLIASRFDLAFEPGYSPLKWTDDICDYFITVKGQLPTRLSVRKECMYKKKIRVVLDECHHR